MRTAKLDEFSFEDITPDSKNNWLNQSDSDFDSLLPLANRETKFADFASDERAVFKLYSLGVASNRDEWTFDFDESAVSKKVQFFCKTYQDEMQRFGLEKPEAASIGDWVNRSIKWTAELERSLTKGYALEFKNRQYSSRVVQAVCRAILLLCPSYHPSQIPDASYLPTRKTFAEQSHMFLRCCI